MLAFQRLHQHKNEESNSALARTRARLKHSLTYLIVRGRFQTVRSLVQTKTALVDLDESDRWWLLNSDINLAERKCVLTRRHRLRIVRASMGSEEYLFRGKRRFETATAPTYNKRMNADMAVGRTPLMLCAMIEDDSWAFSIAQMLIENGAGLDRKDSLGYNALMYACLYERPRLIELFVNALDGHFDLFSQDHYGNTLFHLTSLGSSETMCSIIDKLAKKFGYVKESINIKNAFQHTPIDLCFLNGHETCMRHYAEINMARRLKYDLPNSASLLLSPGALTSLGNIKYHSTKKRPSSEVLMKSNDPKMLKQLVLVNSSRKRVLHMYKLMLYLREPLIKYNEKRRNKKKQTYESTRDEYITSPKSSSPIIITRSSRKMPPISAFERLTALNHTNAPLYRSRIDAAAATTSNVSIEATATNSNKNELEEEEEARGSVAVYSWRAKVDRIFETIELHQTASYRAPTANSASLFEMLTKDMNAHHQQQQLLQQQQQQQQQQAHLDRRTSLGKSRVKHTVSSIKSTMSTSKRASVVSLKNT